MEHNTVNNSEYRAFIKKTLDSLNCVENPEGSFKELKIIVDEHYENMTNIERARTYMEISRAKYYMGDFIEVRTYVAIGLRILALCDIKSEDAVKIFSFKGFLLNLMGLTFLRESDVFTAVNFFSESFENAIAGDDPLIDIFILNNLGNAYLLIGNFTRASEIFKLAIDVLEEKKSYSYMKNYSYILNVVSVNSGTAYSGMNKHKNAKIFFDKIKRNEKIRKSVILESYINDLESFLHEINKEYDKADLIFNTYIKELMKVANGQSILEIIALYIKRILNRETVNNDHLKKVRITLDNIRISEENKMLNTYISLLKLFLVLKEKRYDLFENVFLTYKNKVEDYFNLLYEVQNKAISEQHKTFSLRKEKDILERAKKNAILTKMEVQKEKEKYRFDYDTFRFINEIIRTIRKTNDFLENMNIFYKELKKRVKYESFSVYVLKYGSKEGECHEIFKENKHKKNDFLISELDGDLKKALEIKSFIYTEKNTIVVPLILENDVLGLWKITAQQNEKIREENIRLIMTLSGYVTLVVKSYLLRFKMNEEKIRNEKLKKEVLSVNERLFSNFKPLKTGIESYNNSYDSGILYFMRKAMSLKIPLAITAISLSNYENFEKKYGYITPEKIIKKLMSCLDKGFKNSQMIFTVKEANKFFLATLFEHYVTADNYTDIFLAALDELDIEKEYPCFDKKNISAGCALYIPEEMSEISFFENAAENLLYICEKNKEKRCETRMLNTLKNRKSEKNERN